MSKNFDVSKRGFLTNIEQYWDSIPAWHLVHVLVVYSTKSCLEFMGTTSSNDAAVSNLGYGEPAVGKNQII